MSEWVGVVGCVCVCVHERVHVGVSERGTE